MILLVSALVAASLFNIKVFSHMHQLMQSDTGVEIGDRALVWFHYGSVTFLFQAVIFFLTAVFNYYSGGRLFPRTTPASFRIVLALLGTSAILLLLSFIESEVVYALFRWTGKEHRAIDAYLYINVSITVIAAAVGFLLNLVQRIRRTELENARLKEEKASAELAVLKEQVSPHFFFNTLNSLSAVIRTGSKKDSLEYVQEMSDVYRYILDSESKDTVTLAQELAFLDSYLHLLTRRFGRNLRVAITISDDLLSRLIPPLSLQVLLENAVKHNSISGETPLHVSVESRNGCVLVRNNVTGKKATAGHGTGLANLNKRFSMIMGSEIAIQMDDSRFAVTLPLAAPGTGNRGL